MWKEEDDKLKKNFRFRDFKEAFLFMSEVAKIVDEMDHHPWWSNVYNQVNFELTTHDAGDKVSDKDKKLAEAIDLIAQKYK
jgi:4a-hydroxytetrahydrobiopterin dehydratase